MCFVENLHIFPILKQIRNNLLRNPPGPSLGLFLCVGPNPSQYVLCFISEKRHFRYPEGVRKMTLELL